MNDEIEQEEIKPLIFNYIFHMILFLVYFFLHLVMHLKFFWINNIIGTLFEIFTYFNILFSLFPIFPLIILCKKKYKKKLFHILKILSFILLITAITIGLILFVLFLINSITSKLFYKECPFNISIDHLNAIFKPFYENSQKNEDEYKDKCNSKRCVLDKVNLEEEFPYYYLCNYDPLEDFDNNKLYTRQLPNGEKITSNKQLTCSIVSPNYNLIQFSHPELNSYLRLCYYYADFYRCKRFNEPEKYFDLHLKDKCPESTYLLLLYILCVLIVIMDVIIALLPWGIEYIVFKKLLIILSPTRRKVGSNNSTEKSSVISQNEESYKKEKTPIIISPLEDHINNSILEQDNEIVSQLKEKGVKIRKINRINDISEDKKDNYRPTENDAKKTSERLNANRDNLQIKINPIEENDNNGLFDRDKNKKKFQQSTTLYSNKIKQIEIKIDNNNNDEE